MFIFNKQIFSILCVCFLYDKLHFSAEMLDYLIVSIITFTHRRRFCFLIYYKINEVTAIAHID